MTQDELKQAAIECLYNAFKGLGSPPPHVIQAAVGVLARDL